MPRGLVFIDQAPKTIAKFATSPVQPASYGADRHIEDGSDLLVAPAVKVFQDDDGAVFGAELAEGRLDDLLALGPLEGVGGVGIGG